MGVTNVKAGLNRMAEGVTNEDAIITNLIVQLKASRDRYTGMPAQINNAAVITEIGSYPQDNSGDADQNLAVLQYGKMATEFGAKVAVLDSAIAILEG